MPADSVLELHCPVGSLSLWLLPASLTRPLSIGNTNPSVMNAPQAILAQENNFDCSKLITANNFGQAPGDGYFVQLSNPFNETDVRLSFFMMCGSSHHMLHSL